MNGLQITGMKLASPVPSKKVNVTAPIKPKQTPVTKPTTRKPSIPSTQLQKTATTLKKQPMKKVEQKAPKKQQVKPVQQQPKVAEQKKQQIIEKVEQPKPVVQEVKAVEEPAVIFEVMAKYNHYKEKFPCKNGVLNFAIPNQKYCFGLVFKGNYQPVLRHFKTRDIVEPLTTGKAEQFSWKVTQGEVYEIQIQQDEQEQSKYERHVYKAPQKPKQCPMKKNNKVDELTQQMKNMGIHELGSEKHKQMLEQRDLEDILFG